MNITKTFLFLLAVPQYWYESARQLQKIGPLWIRCMCSRVRDRFRDALAQYTVITIRDVISFVFQSVFRHIKVVWPDLNALAFPPVGGGRVCVRRHTPIGLYDSCI